MTIITTACGSQYSDHDANNSAIQTHSKFGSESGAQMEMADDSMDADSDTSLENESNIDVQQIRKVIYNADIHIEVKDYQKTVNDIQKEINKLQGYIIESTMYSEPEDQLKNGQMTVRIPQEHFQSFIELVEDGSSRVLESSTSGQDVTEAYIDLESRLKSKQIVEDRLVEFMDKAEKTEDLLKISNDLAKVQEEIEEITGKLKYLDNKTDLATVTIYIFEKNVNLTSPGKDQLNTWDQTKEQFMKSTNFIITAFSNLFVLLVGNIPVIILLGIIGTIIGLIIRRLTKKKQE